MRYVFRFLAVLCLCLPLTARAGSSEAGNPVLPIDQVATFSNRVQHDLASRGVHVAIVGRVGRDPSQLPRGIRYTHIGFWVFSNVTRADGSTGTGYRVYNLYQRGDNASRSELIQDSPADFFAGAHRFDAGVIIPDRRLQEKLLRVIASPTYAALHNPSYSVLANPRDGRFQNCTEHTLDVLMAAVYGTSDRSQIKANIAAHFAPQDIRVDGLQRLLAPAASRALTTADHGAQVRTATFGSIGRFMRAHDLAESVYYITPDRVISY
ncbi:DUF2145 domain-containing protein [Yoonia sp. 2307UL14-13]|uniref:DUF2145 domain-containing protein n=1 Tax=Yoonia sp. 2307UL14-13 TaxID=3126506 RepID=UPI0030AFA709